MSMDHMVQCACLGSLGCMEAFRWSDDSEGISKAAERELRSHGWRLDHGRWICGNHDRDDQPTDPQLNTVEVEAWMLRLRMRAQERELAYWRERERYWKRVNHIWNWVWLLMSLSSVAIVAWALYWSNAR